MTERRRRRRRRSEGLDREWRELLTFGHVLLNSALRWSQQCEPVWLEHRSELLREWIRLRPCTRPFAWWRFEAPGPRRLLAGKVTAIDRETRDQFIFTPKLKEIPDRRFWDWFGRPGLIQSDGSEQWETEEDYLQRSNLLLKGEIRLWRKQKNNDSANSKRRWRS